MGVFHIFKNIQMVTNHAMHLIFLMTQKVFKAMHRLPEAYLGPYIVKGSTPNFVFGIKGI